MTEALEAFDTFADDIISSQDNLLKGELDFLLMQCIFESLDLKNLEVYSKSINQEIHNKSYLAA